MSIFIFETKLLTITPTIKKIGHKYTISNALISRILSFGLNIRNIEIDKKNK